jgi:hypothetical protein
VKYPGSTYRFTYDPDHDVLAGGTFEAVARQTFGVRFVRR